MGLKLANNVSTTLATGIGPSDSQVVVVSSARMPVLGAGDYFFLTLQSVDGASIEVVKVTARVTQTLTVVRAQDGTAASTYAAGAYAEMRLCAAVIAALDWVNSRNAVNGLCGLGADGKVDISQLPAALLTEAEAAAAYVTAATVAGTYETQSHAAATFETQAHATATFATPGSVAATYETQAHATATFATPGSVAATYEPKSSFSANGRSLIGAADYATMRTQLALSSGNAPAFAGVTLGGGLTFTKLSISATDPVLADLQDGELRMVY